MVTLENRNGKQELTSCLPTSLPKMLFKHLTEMILFWKEIVDIATRTSLPHLNGHFNKIQFPTGDRRAF